MNLILVIFIFVVNVHKSYIRWFLVSLFHTITANKYVSIKMQPFSSCTKHDNNEYRSLFCYNIMISDG